MLIEILAFLESKNWKYNLISYRMKAGSKQFKEYVLAYEKDYVNHVGLHITKLVILHLHYNKKRLNGLLLEVHNN